MPETTPLLPGADGKSWLDRTLSLFTEVRAGEGATAALMMVNVFLLLICYSIIKIVREPLILLGGGAEVRSYTAAGQALVLMGYVPLYGWFASRVDRIKLLVGVTLFFVINIELFALAVAAHVAYVGVAFFVWVGIFNISLVAQFWSFANDIYKKDAGDRLFPMIVIGMTAGAPIGSYVAGHLFGLGFNPQAILQISAVLLAATLLLYLIINARETRQHAAPTAVLASEGGFALVLRSPYLRLIAILIVLLNIVNTTGEYVIARLLTSHAHLLAAADPSFNAQAYIGSFSGDYQFWVNVTALLIQAFVTSRLVKYQGLRGALLALPLIALGGYTTIAAGAGFAMVRWIKTAENATDYSIMNTARQLLWLPTSREEKYKAKQAIDTFFTRGGDLLSAAVVYIGALRMGIAGFAATNVVLTLVWIGVALMILKRHRALVRLAQTPVAASLVVGLIALGAAGSASPPQRYEGARAAAPIENVARGSSAISTGPSWNGRSAASHVSSPNRMSGTCTRSEPGRSA
jgi:AAA family ATP:ADP antiporter